MVKKKHSEYLLGIPTQRRILGYTTSLFIIMIFYFDIIYLIKSPLISQLNYFFWQFTTIFEAIKTQLGTGCRPVSDSSCLSMQQPSLHNNSTICNLKAIVLEINPSNLSFFINLSNCSFQARQLADGLHGLLTYNPCRHCTSASHTTIRLQNYINITAQQCFCTKAYYEQSTRPLNLMRFIQRVNFQPFGED